MPGTTKFPAQLDDATTLPQNAAPGGGNPAADSHNQAAAILALQTKVGADGSTDPASVDRRLAQVEEAVEEIPPPFTIAALPPLAKANVGANDLLAVVHAGATYRATLVDLLSLTPGGEGADSLALAGVFVVRGLADADVRAAIALARAYRNYAGGKGGGATVLFGGGTYTLTAPIDLSECDGIRFKGQGWTYSQQGSLHGGTVLTASNDTFNLFESNAVDRNAPYANEDAMFADTPIHGGGIESMSLVGGKNAIKVGAKWRAGAQFYDLRDLHFAGQEEWSVWWENGLNCNLENLNFIPGGKKGRLAIGASGTPLFSFGCHELRSVYLDGTLDANTRHVLMFARGGSTLNNTGAYRLQAIGGGPHVVMPATSTAGSARTPTRRRADARLDMGSPIATCRLDRTGGLPSAWGRRREE